MERKFLSQNFLRVALITAFVAILTVMTTGCAPDKTPRYEAETQVCAHFSIVGNSMINYNFNEEDLDEAYRQKLTAFLGKNGMEIRKYIYNSSFSRPFLQGGRERTADFTLKNVKELPQNNITYINGRSSLSEGEILVHKWTYYSMCIEHIGMTIGIDDVKRIIDDKNSLPKYIASISSHPVLWRFGIVSDYYGFGERMINLLNEDFDMTLYRADDKLQESGILYRIAGYYVNDSDEEFMQKEYSSEDFSMFRATAFLEGKTDISYEDKTNALNNLLSVNVSSETETNIIAAMASIENLAYII